MTPNALDAARSRYTAAYDAYEQASKRLAQKLARGATPSAEEVDDEAKATEQLAAARRDLLNAMTRLAPRRH
jgi:hypothetical protein